jgi:hypothetical protein
MPKGTRMEDDLTRAQHYRSRAAELHENAARETDESRRKQLLELADQYGRLADKLVDKHH